MKKQSQKKRVVKATSTSKPAIGTNRHLKTGAKLVLIAILLVIIAVGATLVYFIRDLPSPKTLQSNQYPVATQIFDRHGTLLYEIFADQHRTPVPLNSLPPHVIQATIAIEDKDFYSHFGFSIQGIVRALKNNLFGDSLQGGSTITQQLVKNALLTSERTFDRKIKEAILTLNTEILYSKDEILEMYLNHVPYGGTAYGIEAASRRFFNKPANSLTLNEAALLAGLPQAPTRYSPYIYPERAQARQAVVIRRMIEDGYIKEKDAQIALDAPLAYAPPATDIKAPHFVFYVKDLLEEKYGLHTVEQGGLRVTTSLDLNLQEYAQASVSAQVEELENLQVSNGAALITHPDTGEILAMIGSRDYFDTKNDGQVNLTARLRQPGSSIKPINYVTALQTKKLTPSTLLLNLPTCFIVTGQPAYCPQNYSGGFNGPVQLRFALQNSYNIPAVKVLAINSVETMIATASAMGISTFQDPERYGLSLTLGGGEVTMLDMATAFGTLANQGVKVPLHALLEVKTYTGEVLEAYYPQDTKTSLQTFFNPDNPEANTLGHQVGELSRALNREPAFLMWHILSDNQARATVFGTRSPLYIPEKTVAAKTGTTNDWRDGWTIGYTPQYVVISWVGNNDNSPMNYQVAGVAGAGPIFNELMSFVLTDIPPEATEIEPPAGVQGTNVCALSGGFPTDDQPCDTRFEYFWNENFPQAYNAVKKNIWIDKNTGRPAFSDPDQQPEDVNTDQLELQEHVVLSDPLVEEFCLDCNWTNPETGKTDYPRMQVNMSSLHLASPPSHQ